jgi:hypothetical protein
MSAVVEAVSDVFDFVGDVFETVGDVVEDVVDFVGDVVEKVGDVVQAVIEDPLPVLLSVAGSFIGIPPPVTMGAITAARGGDLQDVVLSMGTAYFAPQVGGAISSTVSSTFIEAGVNETFSQVASNAISSGLVNGTVAEIKGGSFEDGFAGGFTGGMVSGGVREVASYVKPDIIEMAMDNGLDLKDANTLYNAGTRAVSAGITSEITGNNDFATSFTNSAVSSGIDYGVREVNETIDEQFRTAATSWNEKDKQGEPIDVSITGAGIPNDIVSQVAVSDIGVDNDAGTFDLADIFADSQSTQDANNTTSSYTGERATSDISILPETKLVEVPQVETPQTETLQAEAPQAETIYDFADTPVAEAPASSVNVLAEAPVSINELPEEVIDIAEALPEEAPVDISPEPVGALNALADTAAPIVDLDTSKPAVVSEAPIGQDLLTNKLAQESPEEQPIGGLNAVAQAGQATPQEKMATSMGIKPTDFTKPLVATVGNLLKQTLTQKKKPVRRAPATRPVGGLQTASAKPVTSKTPPPQRMDVANLIPIRKAAPTTRVAPPKTLGKEANLTPITNIAGLTSQVKKTG